MHQSKIDDNQLKELINKSYNKLYSQFTSPELSEVGNYRIIKQIGEGGFGKVYLALHRPTHRKVVLKSSNKNDPNVVREVFYHRQFDHPYITKLYEIVITETKVWMALEYCPGKELYEYLLNMHRIQFDECARLFAQIAGAVYYAHSLNCVHRDLKLENILLDLQGNAKLTDFGFTRECATKNQLETVCGTTVYMAPELLRREKYDGFKIDMWSLGIILYTLIKGSMPFDEEDQVMTEWKIMNTEPTYSEKIFSEDSIDLIKKILVKNPSKRPSLEEVLRHKFLEPYGENILEESDKILLKQRKGLLNFNTKIEKRLLKMLKRSGFDKQAIKSSVQKRKCDSLSGLWFLLLEQNKNRSTTHKPSLNKSVLSLTKVFETAFDENEDEAIDNLNTNLIISRTTSLQKNHSFNREELPLDEVSLNVEKLKPILTRGSIISSSTFKNDYATNKNNFFKKVSKFFKGNNTEYGNNNNNNNNNNNARYYRKCNSANKKISRMSIAQKRKENGNENLKTTEKSNDVRNSTKSIRDGKNNLPMLTSFENGEKKNLNADTKPNLEGFIDLEKSKSETFSEYSDNISTDNYNESNTSSYLPGNSSKLMPNFQSRPFSSISQQSHLSNDTYTSDYSTDGNNSSLQKQDTQKQNLLSIQNPQNINKHEKVLNAYGRKFVRRDKSIISTNSTASEISSRADSFYDLATASGLKSKDNSSKKVTSHNLQLSRFDAQRSWHLSDGHNRRRVVRRRSTKHKNYKSTVNDDQFVIQEESSMDSDENNSKRNNELLLSPRINLHDSEMNSSGNDDDLNFKPSLSKSPLQVHYPRNNGTISKLRTLSNDSEWSRRLSTGHDDLSSAMVEEEDESDEGVFLDI